MFSVEKISCELAKKVETEIIKDMVKISINDSSNNFCVMPQNYVDNYLNKIKKMEVFNDDIWVVTFSKCGTTWTQEMVWMLANDLDYETAGKTKLNARFPFLEWSGIWENISSDSVEECKNFPRPRFIKSHLPLFLLPDQLWTVKPKIIYVARNPGDTAVSYYHHHRHMEKYEGTKSDLIQAFAKDLILYSPMNSHVLEFWKIRDKFHVLFLFFEDMKRNLHQEVEKAMKFLGKNYSSMQIEQLCQHLSFDSIKGNRMVNRMEEMHELKTSMGEVYDPNQFTFIRKGMVGGYKAELNADENELLDNYMKWLELSRHGFEYKIE